MEKVKKLVAKLILILKENVPLIKRIIFLIGGLVVVAVGLWFVFVGDLFLRNVNPDYLPDSVKGWQQFTSSNIAYWLILASITAFGSGIACMFSTSFKEKPVYYYILKGLAVLLLVGFIVVLYRFKNSPMNDLLTRVEDRSLRDLTMTVSFILAYISLGFQATSIALDATIKEE